jgi:hypothetical protein
VYRVLFYDDAFEVPAAGQSPIPIHLHPILTLYSTLSKQHDDIYMQKDRHIIDKTHKPKQTQHTAAGPATKQWSTIGCILTHTSQWSGVAPVANKATRTRPAWSGDRDPQTNKQIEGRRRPATKIKQTKSCCHPSTLPHHPALASSTFGPPSASPWLYVFQACMHSHALTHFARTHWLTADRRPTAARLERSRAPGRRRLAPSLPPLTDCGMQAST